MKKILTFFVVLMLGITPSFAKSKDNYSVKFNGTKYNLLYSAKNPEFGGYINEYYKPGETYNLWSEMVGIHHFPNAYSPIDQIIDFRKYLNEEKCPSSISFDEDKNTGIIDFIAIQDKHAPIIMEFNAFKYTKSEKCGSVAIQYAKRYVVKNAFEAEDVKKEFVKNRKKILKQIEKVSVPDVVLKDIDKCVVQEDKKQDVKETTAEKVAEDTTKPVTEENKAVSEDKENPEIISEVKEESKTETEIEETGVVEQEPQIKVNTEVKDTEKTVQEIQTAGEQKVHEDDKKSATAVTEEPKTTEQKINKAKEEKNKEIKINNKKQAETKENTTNEITDYRIETTKYQTYAKPRDYDEIISESKRILKEIKEQKKLNKKNAKKAAKERAKKADKKLKD